MMSVWTVQPESIYKQIIAGKTVDAEPLTHKGSFIYDWPWGEKAYGWMKQEMEKRIGPSPASPYPFWAWVIEDGKHKKPDMRTSMFRVKTNEPTYLLEFRIPEDQLLLSDFDSWHFVLNDIPSYDENEELDWDESDKQFSQLPPKEQQAFKEKSWEKIFDPNDPGNDWKYVQATFWQLKSEEFVRAWPIKYRPSKSVEKMSEEEMDEEVFAYFSKGKATALPVDDEGNFVFDESLSDPHKDWLLGG